MAQCNCTGCNNEAHWQPLLKVSPDGKNYAEAQFPINFCDSCKAMTLLGNLVDDTGWKVIAGGFLAIGRAEPRRELTKLEWKKIT